MGVESDNISSLAQTQSPNVTVFSTSKHASPEKDGDDPTIIQKHADLESHVSQVFPHKEDNTLDSSVDSNIVGWDGPFDKCNPRNFPRNVKWSMTALCG